MKPFRKVCVIGAGSYGTAIAQCFSIRADSVILVSDAHTTVSSVNKLHMNIKSLPGVALNSNIKCVQSYNSANSCDVIFIAVPAMSVEDVCNKLKEYRISVPVVLCSKGFDVRNGQLLSSLVGSILTNEIAVFSGPSFAKEIAQGLPAGVNIASQNKELSQTISKSFSSSVFIIKPIDDFIGLQVAGVMKNILAVWCGVLSGLKMGSNAIARFIVDGLHEMMQLAEALNGKKETFFELGGVGDILLTCTSKQSRNVLFGEYLAGGGTLQNWSGSLAEGAIAAQVIPVLERKLNFQMPIFSKIFQIIYENKCVQEAMSEIIRL